MGVTGGVQRARLVPGLDPPTAATDFVAFQRESLTDGEPHLLGGIGDGGTAAQKHFVFLTMRMVKTVTSGKAPR